MEREVPAPTQPTEGFALLESLLWGTFKQVLPDRGAKPDLFELG